MHEQFDNKDYGEYFSAIEKRLDSNSKNNTQKIQHKSKKKKRRLFGGVLRLRPWVIITVLAITILAVIVCVLPKNKVQQNVDKNKTEPIENVASGIKDDKNTNEKTDLYAK